MRTKRIATWLLTSFVLITIGFAFGKHAGRRPASGGGEPLPGGGDGAVVYYMHATIRCVTCNRIERMARQVVEDRFAEPRAAGRLAWREVDFQQHPEMAARYGVATSCIVVVKVQDGRPTDFRRLDEVWTLNDQPEKFNEYVAGAVRKMLGTEERP